MIHLDTNYLVAVVRPHSPLKVQLLVWLKTGEQFAVSAVVWSEFLTGPVTQQEIRDASIILEGRIVAFGVIEAEMAARLFNQTGRKRVTRRDCFIAATAICSRASLATLNRKDFAPFVASGLRLA